MQSCGVLDLDICPGGGDVFSDLTFFLAMVFCMDLFAWIYSHGFIHMDLFTWIFVAWTNSCLQNRNLSELSWTTTIFFDWDWLVRRVI